MTWILRARRAEQRLRAAGYEPLDLGHHDMPWKARCTTCNRIRYPTVTGVLQDRRKHVRPEKPPPRRRAAP